MDDRNEGYSALTPVVHVYCAEDPVGRVDATFFRQLSHQADVQIKSSNDIKFCLEVDSGFEDGGYVKTQLMLRSDSGKIFMVSPRPLSEVAFLPVSTQLLQDNALRRVSESLFNEEIHDIRQLKSLPRYLDKIFNAADRIFLDTLAAEDADGWRSPRFQEPHLLEGRLAIQLRRETGSDHMRTNVGRIWAVGYDTYEIAPIAWDPKSGNVREKQASSYYEDFGKPSDLGSLWFAIIEREQGSDMRGHELRLLGHQQGHYIAQRKTPGFNQVSVARILPLEATIRHARRQRLGEGFRVDMSSIVVG